MLDYENIIQTVFDQIIKQYCFKLIIKDDEQSFLLAKDFVLSIFTSVEGVNISYITYNDEKMPELIRYKLPFDTRVTDDDRLIFFGRKFETSEQYYRNFQTNNERLFNSLKFEATMLVKRFDDVLKGDRMWLEKYKDKKRYPEEKVYPKVAQFLTSIWIK